MQLQNGTLICTHISVRASYFNFNSLVPAGIDAPYHRPPNVRSRPECVCLLADILMPMLLLRVCAAFSALRITGLQIFKLKSHPLQFAAPGFLSGRFHVQAAWAWKDEMDENGLKISSSTSQVHHGVSPFFANTGRLGTVMFTRRTRRSKTEQTEVCNCSS